jgi:hypothetical protein
MFSLAGEPGYTSTYLLYPIGIIAASVLLARGNFLWNSLLNWSLGGLMVFGLILSTGTSGYVGMIPLIIGLVWFLRPRILGGKTSSASLLKLGSTSIIIVSITFLLFPLITDFSIFQYINEQVIPKITFSKESGVIRWRYSLDAINLFLKYPVLGVGVGSNKVGFLLPGLLSSFGLMGTVPFIAFHIYLLLKLRNIYWSARDNQIRAMALGLLVSLTAVFLTLLTGKSLVALTFPWYWLILAQTAGFIIATRRLNLQRKVKNV